MLRVQTSIQAIQAYTEDLPQTSPARNDIARVLQSAAFKLVWAKGCYQSAGNSCFESAFAFHLVVKVRLGLQNADHSSWVVDLSW